MDRHQHLSEVVSAYFRPKIFNDNKVEQLTTLDQLEYNDSNSLFNPVLFYLVGDLLPLNDVDDVRVTQRE
jgi:hypothetical protein